MAVLSAVGEMMLLPLPTRPVAILEMDLIEVYFAVRVCLLCRFSWRWLKWRRHFRTATSVTISIGTTTKLRGQQQSLGKQFCVLLRSILCCCWVPGSCTVCSLKAPALIPFPGEWHCPGPCLDVGEKVIRLIKGNLCPRPWIHHTTSIFSFHDCNHTAPAVLRGERRVSVIRRFDLQKLLTQLLYLDLIPWDSWLQLYNWCK